MTPVGARHSRTLKEVPARAAYSHSASLGNR